MNEQDPGASRVSRRRLLGGGLGLGVAAAGGAFSLGRTTAGTPDQITEAPPTGLQVPNSVPWKGEHQPGIDRPFTPQRNGLFVITDAEDTTTAEEVFSLMDVLDEIIDRWNQDPGPSADILPDGLGDLCLTVGLGPRLVNLVDPALPGAEGLPAFASDRDLDPALTGGDLLLAIYSSDPTALYPVAKHLMGIIPGARLRWSQSGVRGPGEGTRGRNPLGYHDGVVVPRSEEERDEHIWIPTGAAAGGTLCVVRRLRLDVASFRENSPERQDEIIGRRRADGTPLSGGGPDSEVDLNAKTETGEFLTPMHSHVRAAHPSFTGSPLMLRRSYAYSHSDGPGNTLGEGLLFVSFQNDMDAFIRTQHRMDETDDLMDFVSVSASASFLIPPGRSDDQTFAARLRDNTTTAAAS